MLDILARDGDTGKPRELKITILGDDRGYFQLEEPIRGESEEGHCTINAQQSPDLTPDHFRFV